MKETSEQNELYKGHHDVDVVDVIYFPSQNNHDKYRRRYKNEP